jgi:hypothetical protein
MKIKLYREHGALNSVPIFDALEEGLKKQGHEIVHDNEDIPVIWSVLWNGRMNANKIIYEAARAAGKPVLILEVGTLKRGQTWKVCVNHINSLGQFGNDVDLDIDRPAKLGISLKEPQNIRRQEILIACQHERSLQWDNMPPANSWVLNLVKQIKQHTDRHIVVRPHPRSSLPLQNQDFTLLHPQRVHDSYDEFDIDYNYHCVINHNSGPCIQAAIQGVPVICDPSSLAGILSGKMEKIEEISVPDREDWFLKLCHTEWTIEEIANGIPIKRLEKYFKG